MTQEEVTAWEKRNFQNIKGWTADWTIKEGYKVVTYFMGKDGKQERVVEIEIKK